MHYTYSKSQNSTNNFKADRNNKDKYLNIFILPKIKNKNHYYYC